MSLVDFRRYLTNKPSSCLPRSCGGVMHDGSLNNESLLLQRVSCWLPVFWHSNVFTELSSPKGRTFNFYQVFYWPQVCCLGGLNQPCPTGSEAKANRTLPWVIWLYYEKSHISTQVLRAQVMSKDTLRREVWKRFQDSLLKRSISFMISNNTSCFCVQADRRRCVASP